MKKDILNAKGDVFVCGQNSLARKEFAQSLAGFYPKERRLVSYVKMRELLASCENKPKSKEGRQMVWAFVSLQIINTVMTDLLGQAECGNIARARLDALALSCGNRDIQNYTDLLALVQVALMSWKNDKLSLEIPEALRTTGFILDKICKNVLDDGQIILIIDENNSLWELGRMIVNELFLRTSPEIRVFCDADYGASTRKCLLTNRCINSNEYSVIKIDTE